MLQTPPNSAACPSIPLNAASLSTYIRKHWETLKRSNADSFFCRASDSKISESNLDLLYISPLEDKAKIQKQFARVQVTVLPDSEAHIQHHGLLYLPYPYVVPGSRFNEMYSWDSYFILVGLLRDGEVELAKNIVDNFVYQINYYGKILNANRTYYLTRSQPPFFTRMVELLDPYIRDKAWLAVCAEAAEKYYQFWTKGYRLDATTGLSRYYTDGEPLPCVEVDSERDENGLTHYQRIKSYFREHSVRANYPREAFYDIKEDKLTDNFYLGDRAMRESGFDPSDRFGPFNADCHHYAPVCLNSLLYVMEQDLASMHSKLDQLPKAEQWKKRAADRGERINRLLWSENDKLYLDYNLQTSKQRYYPFVTAFYPLWAQLATPRQAHQLVETLLPLLEVKGGLLTSPYTTGCQWDAPYGWAPMQMIACQGLSAYGFQKEAKRIASSFTKTVIESFNCKGSIFEKYNLINQSAETCTDFGYVSNEVGFGWTNGVVNEFLATYLKD